MENYNSPDPFGIAEGLAPSRPYKQSKSDETKVGQVMGLFERAGLSHTSRIADWSTYLAYKEGDQLVYFNVQTQSVVRVVEMGKKRLWSLNNQLDAICRAWIGKITSGRPTFYVRPGVGGEDQIQGSRVADRLIEYFFEKENIGGKYDLAIASVPWAGVGWLEVKWNALGGRCLGHCEVCGYTHEDLPADVVCPNCQQGKISKIYEGDLEVVQRDPRQVWVQPGVEKFEDMQWVVTRTPLPVADVRQKFPRHALYIHAESDVYPVVGMASTYNAFSETWNTDELSDHVILYEYHEKPSGLYPKGRVVAIANNMVLEEREGVFHLTKRLPFFPFRWQTTSGQFYPTPPISNMWHRQKELNEVETVIREHGELVARTKLILPLGTLIAADEVDATTGQVLQPHPNYANDIRYLMPPMLPAEIFHRREQLIADMRTMIGITAQEANMPMDPNGRAMAIAENESDRSVGHILRQFHTVLADLCRYLLIAAKYLYSPDRKFSIMSDDLLEVYSFQDLTFDPTMSVAIEAEDGFSRNQAIRLQEVGNMVSLGFFVDPMTGMPDQAMIAKAAKLKIPGLVKDSKDSEVQAATMSIKQMEAGFPHVAQVEDDAEVFMMTFEKWLRTQGRRARASKPAVYAAVQQAYMGYMEILFQAQQAQMMQGQVDPNTGLPASPQGSGQSAPGGSQTGTLAEGTAQPDTVNGANQMISQADAQASAAVPQAMQ